MTVIIKGLQLSTISTIDEVLTATWRDGALLPSPYEKLYDVRLNDARAAAMLKYKTVV